MKLLMHVTVCTSELGPKARICEMTYGTAKTTTKSTQKITSYLTQKQEIFVDGTSRGRFQRDS